MFVYEIGGGGNKHMYDMVKLINTKNDVSNICWHPGKHPIFDNNHILTNALIAVGLGCDVFEGITGMGPSVFEKELVQLQTKYKNGNDMISKGLLALMIKKDKNGISRDELITYVHTFMYEPGIEYGKTDNSSA